MSALALLAPQALLPVVQLEHGSFHGIAPGSMIVDHDLALGYVLQHDAAALPCFAALSERQRRVVAFTQSELGFNHGWLVQVAAQSPP